MHRRAGKRKNSHLDDNDLIEVKLKAKKILNIGPHLVVQRILAKRKEFKIHVIRSDQPWSSLVEGDEQPDRPNSQTCMESCHACAAKFIFGLSQTQQLTPWADTALISLY